MAFNLENPIGTGTNAELLELYRACLARISVNQSYTIGNRTFTMADLPEVRKTIDWLEPKVNVEASRGPAVNYAKRMPPV